MQGLYRIAAILGFLNLVTVSLLNGQLTAPVANYARQVNYPVYAGIDSAFIFFSPPGDNIKGQLRAHGPEAGLFTFEWRKYNPVTDSWGPVFQTNNNVLTSLASLLETGGYRVRVYNGTTVDTFFQAWVYIDKLRAQVEKTVDGKVKPFKYTCDFLVLSAAVVTDTFRYYDPTTHAERLLPYGYRYLWTSDNVGLFIPNADRVLDPNTTYLPPTKDTRYFLTVQDSFGMTVIDSVLYESIHVKADFGLEYYDREEALDFVEFSGATEGEAPLLIKFKNTSENGASYEWVFNDTIRRDALYSEITSEFDYEPEFTYYIPWDYYPYLVATSEAGCVDTLGVELPVKVLDSELEVPNVFTPDGDNLNDYFTVNHRSMREFSIRIFNRSGDLVYKAEISDLHQWDGWDGKVLNTGRPASPGAYFYAIEARGWDSVNYRKGPYKGVVYLFREKE